MMATLIFRLNDTPEDEANAIRDLLAEHDIAFYETTSGNWGFSVAGIWLKKNDDKQRARGLIDRYQLQHVSNRLVEVDSFFQNLLKQPLRVIIYLGFILFIMYFSLTPFLSVGE